MRSTICLLITIVALVGCSGDTDTEVRPLSADPGPVRIDSLAPDFTLANYGVPGTTKLSDYRGKPVVLAFWGPWCEWCVREIPDLVALEKTYGESVAILGILRYKYDIDPAMTDTLVVEHGIHYRNTYGTDSVFMAYRIEGYPTTFFIDRKGVVRHMILGYEQGDTLAVALRKTIRG